MLFKQQGPALESGATIGEGFRALADPDRAGAGVVDVAASALAVGSMIQVVQMAIGDMCQAPEALIARLV